MKNYYLKALQYLEKHAPDFSATLDYHTEYYEGSDDNGTPEEARMLALEIIRAHIQEWERLAEEIVSAPKFLGFKP